MTSLAARLRRQYSLCNPEEQQKKANQPFEAPGVVVGTCNVSKEDEEIARLKWLRNDDAVIPTNQFFSKIK